MNSYVCMLHSICLTGFATSSLVRLLSVRRLQMREFGVGSASIGYIGAARTLP